MVQVKPGNELVWGRQLNWWVHFAVSVERFLDGDLGEGRTILSYISETTQLGYGIGQGRYNGCLESPHSAGIAARILILTPTEI